MKYIITSLIVLTMCGCQTAKENTPYVIQTSKEIISIHVDYYRNAYGVEVVWADYQFDENNKVIAESKDVRTAPKVTGKPNQWLHCDVNERPKGLTSRVAYLIDGEMVNTQSFPGVNLVSKIIPLEENRVHVTGIFVASRFDVNKKLIHMSLPIDVICTLDEEIILYEKEIKFEPVN